MYMYLCGHHVLIRFQLPPLLPKLGISEATALTNLLPTWNEHKQGTALTLLPFLEHECKYGV